MGRSGRGLFVTTLIAVLVIAVGVGPASAAIPPAYPITGAAADQDWPTISGDKIVWQDDRNGSADVWYEDLVTGLEVRVTTSTTEAESFLDMDGDLIVWTDSRTSFDDEVWAHDIPTGESRNITNDASDDQGHSRVSGERIIYTDQATGSGDIYYIDWGKGFVSEVCTHAAVQAYPDISGDIAVWVDQRAGVGSDDIYGYDLNTDTEFPVCTATGVQTYVRIHGDTAAWIDYRHGHSEIYRYDFRTNTESRVTSDTANKGSVNVGERYITWTDERLGNYDIFAYDIAGGFVTDVVTTTDQQDEASTSGAFFAWADDRDHPGSFYDIYQGDVGVDWTRAAGTNRYATAVEIAKAHPTIDDNVAIIATGEDFPDALSAAGLAGVFEAPLFLVGKDSVPTEVRAELAARQVDWIIIVGGEGAVSAAVENWLDTRYPGVFRLKGTDRYRTSTAVAGFISTVKGGADFNHVFLARGDSFPDALAVSPISFAREIPILLTRPDTLSGATASALGTYNVQEVIIAGGTGAVSAGAQGSVDGILSGNGGNPSYRWAGTDRYTTAAEIASQAADIDWVNVGYVGIATGLNFPDALAGGPAAGREHGVLLLSAPDALPRAARNFLTTYGDGVNRIEALGGTGVIADSVMDEAAGWVN